MIATTVPDSPSTPVLERDWRFAELVLWTHLDPTLLTRYQGEPHTVLAEFGIVLPAGAAVPALGRPATGQVAIEDLNDTGYASNCFCVDD